MNSPTLTDSPKRGFNLSGMRMRGVLLFLILTAVPVVPLNADDNPDQDHQQILDNLRQAWEERAERFNSTNFVWDETRDFYPGSIIPPYIAQSTNVPGVDPDRGWPLEVMSVEFPREVTIQGRWMRHISRSYGPSKDRKSIQYYEYVSTYDGESSRMLSSNEQLAAGSIRDEDKNTDSGSISFLALLYFTQPFNPIYGKLDSSTLKIVSQNDDGGTLVVEAKGLHRFVVDPERDFIILNWERGNPKRGGVLHEGKIDYLLDEDLGWIPAAWESTEYALDPSVILRQYSADVRHVEAGVEYDRKLFRLEFPVGAQVYNHLTGEEYVVEDDGSTRDVTLFNRGALAQNQNASPDTERSPVVLLIVLSNVFAILLLISIWLFKSRRPGNQ